MRVLPRLAVAGIAAFLIASPVVGQRPDDQINPASQALLSQGLAHYSAGRFTEADDALETALAVDPRNRAAFVAMARVAVKQKLYGQAIRFTNKALILEPTDRAALAVQGQAMVELGAVARAKEILAKLQTMCAGACTEAMTLSAAIARGPTLAAVKPAATTPKTKTN